MPYDAREFFDAGFASFLKLEHDLIVSGVSERDLCARLMLHLEAAKDRFDFGRYVVDVDYNRMGQRSVKYMLKQGGLSSNRADRLVHRRGEPDNLIALEMKKWEAAPAEKERDRVRLQILTLPAARAQEVVVAVDEPLAARVRERLRVRTVLDCECAEAVFRCGRVSRRRAGSSDARSVLRVKLLHIKCAVGQEIVLRS